MSNHPESAASPSTAQSEQSEQSASVQKIQSLLKAKDDTSRFVGLALLKSVLDNSQELREDEDTMATLWESIPPKFLDRMIRTGSRPNPARSDGHHMLDIVIAILHTFVSLLPEKLAKDGKMLDRIPHLVACLLHCSEETTKLTLETLLSMVSHVEGASVFISVDDVTPLTEMAPSQPLVLDIFLHAWLTYMTQSGSDKSKLRSIIDQTVRNLVASFKNTDAVTLLAFLANLLPRLEPEAIPLSPDWLPSLTAFIRNLVDHRPTAASRAAFTNLASALCSVYPHTTPPLLFTDPPPLPSPPLPRPPSSSSPSPSSTSAPRSPSSSPSSTPPPTTPPLPPPHLRLQPPHPLHLLPPALPHPPLPPYLLLPLRTSISETLSLTLEFLRDRYDASVAGALGLHPDARPSAAHVDHLTGAAHAPLAWDAADPERVVAADPLVLAAARALALWLREDDNEMLRREAAGVVDMFVDLYRGSGAGGSRHLDFRGPVLVALEGVVVERRGVEALLENGGWGVLAGDMLGVLVGTGGRDEGEAGRGVEVVRVLMMVVEAEESAVGRRGWMW
ncbi:Neurochondrin-domain-containing protein [Schizothecium vesticola]|uniref:Neurochondrin-domain-containing protein n=1 Tax=Schizothecium vesticola TaxID=314040 RepID=A0AA40EII0_9PEZI|nr:Neurochondrin-domain-containing protein [Schizothecium vesticola]